MNPNLTEISKATQWHRGMLDGSLFALKYLPPLMRR